MKRPLFILVAIISFAGLAGWLLTAVHASYGYAVEAEFSTLPQSDEQLEAWLKQQPGVVNHTVRIERAGATALKVFFIQSRNVFGRPAFPALDRACRELGYGPAVSKFRDSAGG